jgi:tetratricopeptide (TPR) repeat protein
MNRRERRRAGKLGQMASGPAAAFGTSTVPPGSADLLSVGRWHHQAGRLGEAVTCYRRVLAAQPDHAEAWSNLGVALKAQGRLDEAVLAYRQAIRVKPDFAEVHSNLGNALRDQGQLDEALASCDMALSLRPDYTEALNNRGLAFHELKRYDEALASYDHALSLRPDHAAALYNRGRALHELKRLDQALVCYDRALSLRPDSADALHNHGITLHDLKRYDEALASYDRALSLRPDYAEALSNRGNALRELKRLDDAVASYDKALALEPDHVEAFNNRSNMALEKLLKSGRQREADLLGRELARRRRFSFHPNHDRRPRVLRLVAHDLATYVDLKTDEATVRLDGHWESDHLLLDKEIGTITGHLFSDSDPQIVADFIHKTDRDLIVNCIADPDIHSDTLRVAEHVARLARRPVINPPEFIQRHTRDATARCLQGISQLKVPQTVRTTARPNAPAPFPFPFIARVCGTQTGITMELINNPTEFDSFLQSHDSRNIYLTEFIEFRSTDGLYRKYRIRVVGDEFLPNHLFVDTGWNVHGTGSREFMSGEPDLLEEERAFLSGPPTHLDIFREIHERIGVDFYGIDYSILPSGCVVFFEANAAMRSFYPEWRESFPETWAITQRLIHRFTHHLKCRVQNERR